MILPPKLEVIASGVFQSCWKLKDVSIPQSGNLISIGAEAFARCSLLQSVLLPTTGLRRLERWTFASCTSLTHLWIPPTVEAIDDDDAVVHCPSLVSVEVPESLNDLKLVLILTTPTP